MPATLLTDKTTSHGDHGALPPSVERGGGGGSAWVRLTAAANDIDAHLIAGRLAEGGIDSKFMKQTRDLAAWLYGGSNPWAPVDVMVKKIDLDQARHVLAQIALEELSAPQDKGAADG